MIVGVVAVLAAFEQRAELDRLVGFVVVHRTHVEPGQAQRQPGRQGDRHEGAGAGATSFRRAVDLDFDVVGQIVGRVPVGVEPDVPPFAPFGSNSLPSATSMYSLSFPIPSFAELS